LSRAAHNVDGDMKQMFGAVKTANAAGSFPAFISQQHHQLKLRGRRFAVKPAVSPHLSQIALRNESTSKRPTTSFRINHFFPEFNLTEPHVFKYHQTPRQVL